MELLAGTPYMLDDREGRRVVDAATRLHEQVALLRRQGALDESTLEKLCKEWRFRQVYESAGIEGNELSLSETQIAIQRGITISGKPPEHSDEVRNLNAALDYLEQLAQASTPLTEWEVRQINRLVLGSESSDSGAYRKVEVAITNSPHKPPHPMKVPDYMADFAQWLARVNGIPVPLRAAVCHAWLVHIHPFRDGNGRTARAMMNLLLMRQGYPIVIIRRTDRQRYYEALRASDEGDITTLMELFLERCQDSLRQIDRVRHATTGISLALQKVREQRELKYRSWADGIRLFGSTLEELLKKVESDDPLFAVRVTRYDFPSFEDYEGICARDPGFNSWFMKLRLSRQSVDREVLLWLGFASDESMRILGIEQVVPALKISTPNPAPPPSWITAEPPFPSPAREFLFERGRYMRLEIGDKPAIRTFDTVVEASASFIAELISGYFAG